jgi:hypothetical protein
LWCDESKPIENGTYGSLDGGWIVPTHAIEEPAGDKRVNVGSAHLDRVAPKAAASAIEKPRHPDRARLGAALPGSRPGG